VIIEEVSRFLIGILIGIPLGAYAYKKSYLEKKAAVLSILFSGVYLLAGVGVFITSLFFFFSSSMLTRLNFEYKRSIGASEKESGRSLAQVIGAGVVAALLSVLYVFSPHNIGNALLVGVYVAIASSNADTWAAEIGSLSKSKPRLITRPSQVVEAGTSGGVTMLGTFGSLLGSFLTAAVAMVISIVEHPGIAKMEIFSVIFILGWLGEVIDSLVGATLQVKYYCPRCNTLTDKRIHKCGSETIHVSGYSYITNEVTNIIATSIVSIAAIALELL
jgi:uncharacterized protein (TIGR00297 family)